jgi:hypothetical protein
VKANVIEGLQAERGKTLRIDKELIHIVFNALFSGIFETVNHDMPRKKIHMFTCFCHRAETQKAFRTLL